MATVGGGLTGCQCPRLRKGRPRIFWATNPIRSPSCAFALDAVDRRLWRTSPGRSGARATIGMASPRAHRSKGERRDKLLEKRQIVARLLPMPAPRSRSLTPVDRWKTVATATKRGAGGARACQRKGGVVWDHASDENGRFAGRRRVRRRRRHSANRRRRRAESGATPVATARRGLSQRCPSLERALCGAAARPRAGIPLPDADLQPSRRVPQCLAASRAKRARCKSFSTAGGMFPQQVLRLTTRMQVRSGLRRQEGPLTRPA